MYFKPINRFAGLIGVLMWAVTSSSTQAETLAVEPYEYRPAIQNTIVEERLDTLLPRLMREAGLDMWLVIAREYNDDPVFLSLTPTLRFTAH